MHGSPGVGGVGVHTVRPDGAAAVVGGGGGGGRGGGGGWSIASGTSFPVLASATMVICKKTSATKMQVHEPNYDCVRSSTVL